MIPVYKWCPSICTPPTQSRPSSITNYGRAWVTYASPTPRCTQHTPSPPRVATNIHICTHLTHLYPHTLWTSTHPTHLTHLVTTTTTYDLYARNLTTSGKFGVRKKSHFAEGGKRVRTLVFPKLWLDIYIICAVSVVLYMFVRSS